MPQIQQTAKGGVIVYDQNDFFGLASGYGGASQINYQKVGNGAEYLKAVNPYLNALGALQPGLLGTALTNAAAQIAATINAGVVERTGTNTAAWLIEAGAKIHRIDSLVTPYTISTTAPFPYTIEAQGGHVTHTTPVGEDIITFNISGTEYVFYSYTDNTDGDVGRVIIAPVADNSDFDDDWFSTASGGAVLNKNVPHPMIIGDDQKFYIADLAASGTLAKLWQIVDDGDGTVTISSFTTLIPRNYVIRDFAKNGEHLVIFANKIRTGGTLAHKGDVVAFFWDYSASSADYKYHLDDNDVTCGFNFGGVLGCFTTGRVTEFANVGYRSKLQIFEGGRFMPKFNFSEEAPKYGGYDIVNNMLCWNSGGVIYSYGSPYPDYPARVNKIAQGASTTNGFLKALNGIEIYVSTGSGANNEVFQQATTFHASSDWRGLVADPLFPLYTQGMVDYVEIGFYGSASGGRAMTFTLDFDYGTYTKTVLDALTTVTAGKQILYRDVDTSNASFPLFKAIKPIISWATGSGSGACPKISYIKIYYSLQPLNT